MNLIFERNVMTAKKIDKSCLVVAISLLLFTLALPTAKAGFDFYKVPAAMLKMVNNSVVDTMISVLGATEVGAEKSEKESQKAGQGQAKITQISGGSSITIDPEAGTEDTDTESSKSDVTEQTVGLELKDKMVRGNDPTVKLVKNAFKIFALIWAIVIALIKSVKLSEDGKNDTLEMIARTCAEICITAVLIMNCDAILNLVIEYAVSASDAAVVAMGNPTEAVEITLKNVCGKSKPGFITSMGVIIALILPWGLSLLLKIAAYFACFSILIEIGIRTALFPFYLCTIYRDGLRSSGMHSIKKLIASIVKISVAILICAIARNIIGYATYVAADNIVNSIVQTVTFCITNIAVNFTVIGLVMRCGEFVNDAFGV